MLPTSGDLIAKLPTGGYLVMPVELIDSMRHYRQSASQDAEAGGLLIGYRRLSSSPAHHIELAQCSFPGHGDIRQRFLFIRKSPLHIQMVMRAWEASENAQTYLGEWHTHPQKTPEPSAQDIAQWNKSLSGRTAILIIIGLSSDWVAYWDGRKPIRLDVHQQWQN